MAIGFLESEAVGRVVLSGEVGLQEAQELKLAPEGAGYGGGGGLRRARRAAEGAGSALFSS